MLLYQSVGKSDSIIKIEEKYIPIIQTLEKIFENLTDVNTRIATL